MLPHSGDCKNSTDTQKSQLAISPLPEYCARVDLGYGQQMVSVHLNQLLILVYFDVSNVSYAYSVLGMSANGSDAYYVLKW